MLTIRQRRYSRHSGAHYAWQFRRTKEWLGSCLPPRGRCNQHLSRLYLIMIDIAVVDYGMGNLRSVSKALEYVAPDKQVVVTSNPAEIEAAERVVFPGQGAMPDCMRELDDRGLRNAVVEAAANKPFLGICIGLQLLFEHSEEGNS